MNARDINNELRGADAMRDEVEQELAAALGEADVDQLMAETSDQQKGERLQRGQVLAGTVSALRSHEVLIEPQGYAGKLVGVAPAEQFEEIPELGQQMNFEVVSVDESEGVVRLSRQGAVQKAGWDQLKTGLTVEGRVTGYNKGGLELELAGSIEAFMPAGQIDFARIDDLETMVGRKLEAQVVEFNRRAKRVIVSRREWLEHRREQRMAELEAGQEVNGTVTRLADFGAFVDIDGLEGLLHISDLSHARVGKVSDVIDVGHAVTVKILKVEPERKRVSLGLKQLQADPWETAPGRFHTGQIVAGRVTKVLDFGAFVEIEPGLEGLVPVSEISRRRVNHPSEAVAVGDELRLTILRIEPEQKRLSLSLKEQLPDPWVGAEHRFPRGELVEGAVTRTTDFGAFVEIEAGLEGLCHISELSTKRVNKVEDVLRVGDKQQFRILEVDEDEKRMSLSVKAVDNPPVEAALDDAAYKDYQAANPPRAKKKLDKSKLRGGGIGQGSMGLGDLRL